MKSFLLDLLETTRPAKVIKHHVKCGLRFDAYNGDYDCEYQTTIACEYCKYGGFGGRKDPEAKCNQLKG